MQEVIEGVSKRCTGCGEVKPLEEFHKGKGFKDGRRSKCKKCTREYNKRYRQENAESEKTRHKQYYQENAEAIKTQKKQYRQTEKGKEVDKAKKANRRAMKLALPYEEGSSQWIAILASYDNKCAITGKIDNVSLEHFIPLSCGHGGSCANNIYPMIGSLNCSKSNKNPFKWAEKNLKGKQYENFLNVARRLAELNGMTLKEYRKFVTWCVKNPRTVEQVKADNELGLTSIDLWKRSLSNQ